MSTDITSLVDRLCYRCPACLADRVLDHEPGKRIVAIKNVTIAEDFFQGHFPGAPVMPGVLMIESMAQVSTMLVLSDEGYPPSSRAILRGATDVKFRRQVVPGDQVRIEVARERVRGPLSILRGTACIGDQVVFEARLVMAVATDAVNVHPTAVVHSGAVLGPGTTVGPHATIGPLVRIGRRCSIGASAVIDGWTEIGDDNRVHPMASIGQAPQDLKYKGEPTRLVIGNGNILREFVTIHRGTAGGGGVTQIGDRNLFMAYAHVAHDCHVGNDTIFGNGATLGGHVTVEDFATVSALSGVHQFCRVGRHAFIGAYSAVTLDAMPYARTVGNRARIYGLNTIGLARRGFSPETISKLRRAYRYLLVSRLNTTQALARIESDEELDCPEVRYLVHFIRTSPRGVLLRRGSRRIEDRNGE